MDLLLAQVLNLALRTHDISKEMRTDYERLQKCIIEKTCELVQKDGYLQVNHIDGAKPVASKYQCLREQKCSAYWINKQVVIVPKGV